MIDVYLNSSPLKTGAVFSIKSGSFRLYRQFTRETILDLKNAWLLFYFQPTIEFAFSVVIGLCVVAMFQNNFDHKEMLQTICIVRPKLW